MTIEWYAPLRAALFKLDPEKAHDLAFRLGELPGVGALMKHLCGETVEDPVELMGLSFRNRVGLAAGLDKNGRHIDLQSQAGFGFVEVGTVTPKPQPGNPKPRLFRLSDHRAIINRFGFNNEGIDAFLTHVASARFDGIIGLNIGKNASTPIENATDDYLIGLRRCHPIASYITVNVSSPNTSNLRALQHDRALSQMLAALVQERGRLQQTGVRHVPLLLKIAPDLSDDQIDEIAGQLVRHQLDGVIATNTTTSRAGLGDSTYREQAGGLSGMPLRDRSTAIVSRLRRSLPEGFPIIGVGGIQNAQDATEKFSAGADLIQLYTGLIYQGPRLVAECALAGRRHFRDSY